MKVPVERPTVSTGYERCPSLCSSLFFLRSPPPQIVYKNINLQEAYFIMSVLRQTHVLIIICV